MKKVLLCVVAVLATISALAGDVLTVKFTGENAETKRHVQLDSVVVMDLSKSWEQTIFYPDTVLELSSQNVGIDNIGESQFGIVDLHPNPFNGITQFDLIMP